MRLLPLALAAAVAAPAAHAQPRPEMEHDHTAGAEHAVLPEAATPPSESGALGPYPLTREASGTAWQPDVSAHAGGMHAMRGGWMLMGHAVLNAVYDRQQGPRGDEKIFASGMVMGMARRDFASGDALQLRAMFSPDPLMGRRGYPLLLAAGETADGATTLVDRQHPHDIVMELSASYSRRLSGKDSVFLYAGLPGEPAFGPPAFMHRASIMASPEAPISHHWLDSTHIVFGVVTAGYVHDAWKVEVSRFKGREPDQRRYDIESPKLDSTALRLSWNPTPQWSLQGSWAQVKGPEQLEPDRNDRKWSASVIHTRPLGAESWWSTTLAWGRRRGEHGALDAWALESAVKPNAAWTTFARAERVETDELAPGGGHHGAAFTVGKVSAGAVRDWRVAPHVKLGLGGLYAWNIVPRGLKASYGGSPQGAMAFVRATLD
jgi:hypothetical protein